MTMANLNTELTGPDWVGVAVHYPDGQTYIVQIDDPRGVLEIETEQVETTWDVPDPMWRTYRPGEKFARVEFSGRVGDLQRRSGPRPDWPTAPAGEITEGPREIEGS